MIIDKKVIVDNNFEGDAKEVDNRGPNVLGLSTDMNNEASQDNYEKLSDVQCHLSTELVYPEKRLAVCKSLSSSSPKRSKVKNVVILKTSSSKRLKQAPIHKSPAGIKPFLCLKGKIGGECGSPKARLKKKSKIKLVYSSQKLKQ